MALSVGVYKHLVGIKNNRNSQQASQQQQQQQQQHPPSRVNDPLLDRKSLDGYGLHESQKEEAWNAVKAAREEKQQSTSTATFARSAEELQLPIGEEGPPPPVRPLTIRLGSGKIVQHQGIAKTNILLMGSTGTGKTLLAQTLAELIGVPMVIADATSLTQAGYVGEDVDSLLAQLYVRSGYDLSTAERGIVYIDEIDKIARKSASPSISRDVSGEGVQQSLLKLLEGSEVHIPKVGLKLKPGGDTVTLNTQHILFICAGSFAGIEDIIAQRLLQDDCPDSPRSDETVRDESVQTGDLMKFGLIPEFIGRFPIVTATSELTLEELTDIVHQPKNALLKQFEYFFALHHMELVVTADACRAIAKKALMRGTGARGLRSIVEKLLTPVMFHLPDNMTTVATASAPMKSAEESSSDVAPHCHTALVDADVVLGETGVLLLRGDLTAEEYLAHKRKVKETGNGEDMLRSGDDRVVEVSSTATPARLFGSSVSGGASI